MLMKVYRQTDELYHHGIKGQRWGVIRYQKPDGSLTPSGIKKLEKFKKRENRALDSRINNLTKSKESFNKSLNKSIAKTHAKAIKRTEELNNKGMDSKGDKKLRKYAKREATLKDRINSTSAGYDYAINRVNNAKKTISNYTLDDVKNEKSAVFKKNMLNGGRNVYRQYEGYAVEMLDSYSWAKDVYREELRTKNK